MCVLLCPWGWILWALLTSAKLLPVSFKLKNEAKILNKLCNPTYFNILYLNKLCLRQAMQIQWNQRNRALRFGLDWIQRLKYCLCLRESDREYLCAWQQLITVIRSSTGLGRTLTGYYFHIKDLSHWQGLTCMVQYQSWLLLQKQFLQLFLSLLLCLNLSLFSVTSVRTFKVHSSRFFVTRVTSASHAGVERSSWIKHYALPPPKQPPSVGSISVSLQLSSKERINASFPSNIPYFTLQDTRQC